MLRDPDEERTAEDEAVLRERVGFLSKRIVTSQKALSDRSMLKSHVMNFGTR